MQLIWRMTTIFLILSGCAVPAKPEGIRLSITYANIQPGIDVLYGGGYTDRGNQLPSMGTLRPTEDMFQGPTMGSPIPEPGLPEWVEFTWQERDIAKRMPNETWIAMDASSREAYLKELRALPFKSARVQVRSLVPEHVIEELQRSPRDPKYTTLRWKSLSLYYIWTSAGVKVKWRAYQGCCTVIHEGGDAVTTPSKQ